MAQRAVRSGQSIGTRHPAVPVTKVQRTAAPLREQIVERIFDAIAAGDFSPGQRLIERDLCERYEVSRTVVREALRSLEAQGLIQMVPNRGPVVAVVSTEEAVWLFEVRASLEGLAARCFAERATAAEREALHAAMDKVAALIDSDMVALLAAKDEFYDVIFAGAHNPIIGSMLRNLHARIRILRSLSLGAPGRGKHTVAELRAILKAVNARDGERADALAKRHVDRAAAVALKRLAREGEYEPRGLSARVTLAAGSHTMRRAPH